MFYTLQITKIATDAAAAKQCFEFSDLNAAKANHFYFLSTCYSTSTLDYFMGEILDENGICIAREVYHKPAAPVVEEEPEEVEE